MRLRTSRGRTEGRYASTTVLAPKLIGALGFARFHRQQLSKGRAVRAMRWVVLTTLGTIVAVAVSLPQYGHAQTAQAGDGLT